MTSWRNSWLTRPGQALSGGPWAGMSNGDLLARWDGGHAIWTCKMTDMSPSYEQCVHEIGMEMLRAMLANPFDLGALEGKDSRAKLVLWQTYSSQIMEVSGVRAEISRLEPEGMQIRAATNVASMFAQNGYEAEMDKVPEARRILLSKALQRGVV